MAGLPFFVCSCSSCKNPTELQIDKLGRSIACSKCGKSFVAQDSNAVSAAVDDPVKYWIEYTDHVYSKSEFDVIPRADIHRTPR